MEFRKFKQLIQNQFETMTGRELFKTDIDKTKMWNLYLDSFPKGTNPIFRERREFDCQCCKHFVQRAGNIVTVRDNKLISIWDIEIDNEFQVVADAMSKYVKSKFIRDIFKSGDSFIGTNYNVSLDGIKWEHFYLNIPDKYVVHALQVGTVLADAKAKRVSFEKSLNNLTLEAGNTVLELIEQNSLYRGREFKDLVKAFIRFKTSYDKIKTKKGKDFFCWTKGCKAPSMINTVVGTLLLDISNEVDLNEAVKKFESKVAPMNYKRPTALITQTMIKKAQEKVAEFGAVNSLYRRYAVAEDISINNVLFADRSTKKVMQNVFDDLSDEVRVDIKDFEKMEVVSIKTFIDDILPRAKSVELLFENKHANNLVSLIAPVYPSSKNILKWGNNFSWAYNGEVADSIKERVKQEGGNVNGVLRCSLSWYNYDDLDLHVKEPRQDEIYYGNKKNTKTGVFLDVDMNAGLRSSRNAVENIVWTDKRKMAEGVYHVFVNQYQKRETKDVGFEVEMEYDGTIYSFHYDKAAKGKLPVITFSFSREDGIKIIKSIPSTQASKEVWNISTNSFQKVKMIMNSPNHWDEDRTGNKHFFFMLENCNNEEQARGFFNEFLSEDLRDHRKVFEVLGSKMKTDISDNQLSGVGFSSTQKASVVCKVAGTFNRTIIINI